MTETDVRRVGPADAGDGSLTLAPAQAENLRAALRQMELLMHAQHPDAGVGHLVAMLRHLQAVRQALA